MKTLKIKLKNLRPLRVKPKRRLPMMLLSQLERRPLKRLMDQNAHFQLTAKDQPEMPVTKLLPMLLLNKKPLKLPGNPTMLPI